MIGVNNLENEEAHINLLNNFNIYKDTIYKKIVTKNDRLLTLKSDNKNILFKRKGLIKFIEKK